MTKTIWICPIKEDLLDEMIKEKHCFHKDVIIVHSSKETVNFPFQQNVRLKGETLQQHVVELEHFLEQLGNKGETICIITENAHKGLTESALFFLMAHFPTQTIVETSMGKWKNYDVNWKYEEVYHAAHHFISQNKFSSAEILLNTYVKNKDIFHLIHFGKNLLNGDVFYPNENNKWFYFNLLSNGLEQLQEDEEEIAFVHEMKGLAMGEQKPFIYFLQNYCKHLYENEDLVDFVVLFYRLAEELLLYAMGWDVNEHNYYVVRENTKENVPFKTPFSRHFSSYLNVVEQQLKRYPNNDYLQKVNEDFTQKWLLNFLNLRHEGVSGHGFMHYHVQLFEEICGGNPLEKMNELLEKYNVKANYDVFEIVQKVILAITRQALVEENFVAQN